MRKPTKGDLLEHYAKRDPVGFIQFDDFTDPKTWDDVVKPDKDGHCIHAGTTHELMTGIYGVRVLVRPDIPKEVVLKSLSKIRAWIRRDDILEVYANQFKKMEKLAELESELENVPF